METIAKCSAGPVPKKTSVAEEILEFASQLSLRAGNLAEQVHGKLGPIMDQATNEECQAEGLMRTYPPLWNELRDKFYGIENALRSIEDAMYRTEL